VQYDGLFEVIPPALDADPWDDPPTLKLRTICATSYAPVLYPATTTYRLPLR